MTPAPPPRPPGPGTPPPKYLKVAARLEEQFAEGKWEGYRMPSVRGVALEHGVSVVTASRALQVLQAKGLIQTVERSGCYRVPAPDAERWALCLRLTPGPWRPMTEALLRGGFEALARRQPMRLEFGAFDLRAGLSRAEAVESVAQALLHDVRGVVLLPNRVCEAEAEAECLFVEACREAGLPVVLFERNLRGRDRALPCDLVTVDDLGGAVAATQHLLDLGRGRVGFVTSSPTSSHDRRAAGYVYCLSRAAGPHEPAVIQHDSGPGQAVSYRALCDEVLARRLDGVVCYSDYAAVGLVVELLRRGHSVPGDVAVVGFDDLPVGDLVPGCLTTYSYPAEAMAEHAVRLLRERRLCPGRAPVQVVVPGELIARGSTAGGVAGPSRG